MPNYPGKLTGRRRIVIWHNGKPREWVIEGTKRDGDEFEARKRLELKLEVPTERRAAVTFFELCEEYAVHGERHLKASTWQTRTYQIDALTTHMGGVRITELNPGLVETFKLARLEAKVTAPSINNELRILRTVLNWAKELGHPVPAFKWRRLPERGAPRPRAFTLDELQRLYAACREKAPLLLPIVVFLVNTGCRKGEAIAAEWSWIDFDSSLIRIPSNAHWQPKNGLPREVPMSDAVRAVLSGPRRDKRFVFPHLHGGPLAQFPKELWGYAVSAARLTGGPHQLRHTFASHFLANKPDMKMLSEILGHSHQRITDLYTHMLPGRLDGARNVVNIGPETMAVPEKTVGRKNTNRP